MPDLSRAPAGRLPFDRLLEVLPTKSPLRDVLIAGSTFVPEGPETQVSFVKGDEVGAASAGLVGGQTIVVWNDFGGLPATAQSGDLQGRLLNSAGVPIGVDLQLSSGGQVFFNEFNVAALANGGFVVVWSAISVDGSGLAVMAKTFAADGTATSQAVLVNTNFVFDQRMPDVAGLEGGGFVVAWADLSRVSNGQFVTGVKGRLFNDDAVPLDGEFKINTSNANTVLYPSVSALEDGGFVSSWTDAVSGRATSVDIRAQAFSASGVKVAAELTVNAAPRMNDQHSDVVGTADGGFVLVWRQLDLNTNLQTIRGQKFTSATDIIGDEFVVAAGSDLDVTPKIAALEEGGFVVTWEAGALGSEDVYARAFHNPDDPWTPAFLVNAEDTDGRQLSAGVSATDNGFLVHWVDINSPARLAGEVEVRNYALDWA